MVTVKTTFKNLDAFKSKCNTILQNKVSIPVENSIKNAKSHLDILKSQKKEGVFTEKLYNKITLSTYKSGKGKEGKFLKRLNESNNITLSIFIARPDKEDRKILSMLEFGINSSYWWYNKEQIREWLDIKGIEFKNPKTGAIFYPNKLEIGATSRSAYYGGGKSPMQIAKNKIMTDIERRFKIKFKEAKK